MIGFILLVFNEAGTVYSRKAVPNITLSAADYDALTDRSLFEGKEYRVGTRATSRTSRRGNI